MISLDFIGPSRSMLNDGRSESTRIRERLLRVDGPFPVFMVSSGGFGSGSGLLEEGEQIHVDLVFAGGAHAVRGAGDDLQLRSLDEFDGEAGGVVDGDDLVVVSVEDEGGDIEL